MRAVSAVAWGFLGMLLVGTPVLAEDPAPAAAPAPDEKKIDQVIDSAMKPAPSPSPKPAKSAKPAKKPAVKKPARPNSAAARKPKTPAVKAARVVKPQGSTKPISAFELGRYQYCGDDRDCQKAVNGCCDCANGGEDVAVNRERYEAFRARFSCLYVSCGEKKPDPRCESGVVSCVNHKCRYISEGLEDKF